MIDNKKVGQYIYTLRKEKDLTQSALAEKLNISHQAVSKWEKGKTLPDTELLVELSNLLNVTIDDF